MTEYRDLSLDLNIIQYETLARDIKEWYGWISLEEFIKDSGIGIEFIIIYINTYKTCLNLPSLKLYYEGEHMTNIYSFIKSVENKMKGYNKIK